MHWYARTDIATFVAPPLKYAPRAPWGNGCAYFRYAEPAVLAYILYATNENPAI